MVKVTVEIEGGKKVIATNPNTPFTGNEATQPSFSFTMQMAVNKAREFGRITKVFADGTSEVARKWAPTEIEIC